ncbi:MAG: hypothetical protein AAF787_07090 [Chloroflexota bacterium]
MPVIGEDGEFTHDLPEHISGHDRKKIAAYNVLYRERQRDHDMNRRSTLPMMLYPVVVLAIGVIIVALFTAILVLAGV